MITVRYMFLFVTLALAAQAASLRPLQPTLPRIDTYVINLDSRTDRCECMQRQLQGWPSPLYRQSADGVCPNLTKAKEINHPAQYAESESSLFCQNYQIWQAAEKSDAEYVLIMEDDALLASGFFGSVQNLVRDCREFDYLNIDPIILKVESAVKHKTCPGVMVKQPSNPVWQGTPVQLIRRTFLPTMIEKAELVGWGALDDWWQHYLGGAGAQRAYAWLGRVAIQASHGWEKPIKAELERLGCPWSVTKSDIGMGHISKRSSTTGTIAPLRCGGQ
mmetsp:Transcript_79371/g.224479  ORF Transcript_79371/g.224479 Transcript_79371/m.224479 type:complete len:276 (-) Transcript_79371:20-847(-)